MSHPSVLLLLLLLTTVRLRGFTAAQPSNISMISSTVCYHHPFTARCSTGSVIMIETAVYGRMRTGGCINISTHIGCQADATFLLKRQCSGRRSCNFTVGMELSSLAGGCTSELQGFLEVTHYCQSVYEGTKDVCNSRTPIHVMSSSGYLANVVTFESAKGSSSCPWIIRPSIFQTVSLNIMDFSVSQGMSQEKNSETCQILARIFVGEATQAQIVCAGDNHQTPFLKVVGRKDIRISITNNTSSSALTYFLIKYEVSGSVRCADYESSSPHETVVSRTNDSVQIRCTLFPGSRTWTVTCADGQWIADSDRVDCAPLVGTATVREPPNGTPSPAADSSQSIVIALSVVLVIALLVIASGIFCCLYYLRRKPRSVDADSCPYGTASTYYNGHSLTLPICTYDRATIDGRSRSQRDLCCSSAVPHWPTMAASRAPGGNYSTTLDMRLNAYGGLIQQQQRPLPGDVWTTTAGCPVHSAGGYNTGTFGCRHHSNHIYDMPMFANHMGLSDNPMGHNEPDIIGEEGNGGGVVCTSPFYHELDQLPLGYNDAPATSSETTNKSDALSRI
jgi:hypothetical protein